MAKILNKFSKFAITILRLVAAGVVAAAPKIKLKNKEADAQDWKRRKAEVLWKEAVEIQNTGNFVKALEKWTESAKFESDSSEPRLDCLANIYNEIGYCNYRNRNFAASKEYYELSLATYNKLSVFKGASTAYTMNNYALLLLEVGEVIEAEKLIKHSLKILEKSVGEESPLLAYILNNMARAYNSLNQYDEAEKILNRALKIEAKMMVNSSPEVTTTLELLAVSYFNQKKYKLAEQLFIQVVKQREETKGKEHVAVISALFALGNFYSDIGEYDKSEQPISRCLNILEINYGADHHFLGVFLNQLGWVSTHRGQLDQAEMYFNSALAIAEKYVEEHRIELAVTLYNSALLDCRKDSYDQAWNKLVRAMALFASTHKVDYMPVIEYAIAIMLERRNQNNLAVFFAKISIQDSMDRLEYDLLKPFLPRWLFFPPDSVSVFLNRLLVSLGRLGEAQAMYIKLDPWRIPASNLHGKIRKHLIKYWGLNDVEKVWESHYKAWLRQARLCGENLDTKDSDDSQDSSIEPVKKSEYNSIDELVAGLAALLEKFRVAKVMIKPLSDN
ncbi:MAG: tetratricopeptide repeat protein [Magnetococcales bacterium]|nr:tetratricopeptide repeat protein [Magnetococcales bacterium]